MTSRGPATRRGRRGRCPARIRSSASRSTAATWRVDRPRPRRRGRPPATEFSTSIPSRPASRCAQVRVQLLLDLADQLLRRADDEVVERLPLEAREQRVERVADVVELLLLHRALVARLRPAALVVLAGACRPRCGRPPPGPSAVADEDPRGPAVHEQHAPALAGPVAHERLDAGVVVDDRARLDRVRQRGRPRARRRARRRTRPARAYRPTPRRAAQHVAHPLDVGAQRHPLLVRRGPRPPRSCAPPRSRPS